LGLKPDDPVLKIHDFIASRTIKSKSVCIIFLGFWEALSDIANTLLDESSLLAMSELGRKLMTQSDADG
jgi:hypothetical protein